MIFLTAPKLDWGQAIDDWGQADDRHTKGGQHGAAGDSGCRLK